MAVSNPGFSNRKVNLPGGAKPRSPLEVTPPGAEPLPQANVDAHLDLAEIEVARGVTLESGKRARGEERIARLGERVKLTPRLNADRETPARITSIPLNWAALSPEERERVRGDMDMLKLVTTSLLALVFSKRQELIDTFDSYDAIGSLAGAARCLPNMSSTERAALAKIGQFILAPQSDAAMDMRRAWNGQEGILAAAKFHAQRLSGLNVGFAAGTDAAELPKGEIPAAVSARGATQKAKGILRGGVGRRAKDKIENALDKLAGKEQEEGGFWSKVKENLPTIAVVGITIVGSIALYKLFSKMLDGIFGEDGDKKSEGGSIIPSLIKGGLATALTSFLAGRAIGFESVEDALNLKGSAAAQFLKKFARGDMGDALEVLWKGVDEKADFHQAVAQKINTEMDIDNKDSGQVTGKVVFDVSKRPFREFIDEDWLESGTAAVLTGIGVWSEDTQKAETAIRGFLNAHKLEAAGLLAIREDTTVGAVLNVLMPTLEGKQIQPAVAAAPEVPQMPQAAPTVAAAASAGGLAATAATKAPTGQLAETPKASPTPIPAGPDERKTRDMLIDKLPPKIRRRATANEYLLERKITNREINDYLEKIGAREKFLREKLADAEIKRSERATIKLKLRQLEQQKIKLEELLKIHNAALAAYNGALASGNENHIFNAYTDLFEAKQKIEFLFDDIFEKEGWSFIIGMAGAQSLRIANEVRRRFLTINDINVEYATYLFGKNTNRLRLLRPRNATAAWESRHTPLPALTDDEFNKIVKNREKLDDDIQRLIKERRADGQHYSRGVQHDEFFREFDTYEARVIEQQRTLQRYWDIENAKFKSAIRRGNHSEIALIKNKIERLAGEKVKLEVGATEEAIRLWRTLSSMGRGTAYREGVNRLRTFMTQTVLHHKIGAGKILVRGKKFLGFYGVSVAIGTLGAKFLGDDDTEWGQAAKNAAIMAAPVVGTIYDFKAMWTGEEPLSGRKLDTSDRVVAGLFGLAGAASDALMVLGGVGAVGKGFISSARTAHGLAGARTAQRTLKAIEAGRSAGEIADMYDRARTVSKAYRGLSLTSKVLGVATVGYTGSQVINFVWHKLDDVELPDDFRDEVLEGLVEDVDETGAAIQEGGQPEAPAETGEGGEAK